MDYKAEIEDLRKKKDALWQTIRNLENEFVEKHSPYKVGKSYDVPICIYSTKTYLRGKKIKIASIDSVLQDGYWYWKICGVTGFTDMHTWMEEIE